MLIYAYKNTQTHTYPYTHTSTYSYMYSHTYLYDHTYTQTHTHTHGLLYSTPSSALDDDRPSRSTGSGGSARDSLNPPLRPGHGLEGPVASEA